MKKTLLSLFTAFLISNGFDALAQTTETSLKIYDKITFYDMYNKNLTLGPVPDGFIRLRNDLYTTRLTPEQLQSLGDKISFKVTINALCDNYDRIGNVNLALVPKELDSYTPGTSGILRIEVGRYITPFMNKNKSPNSVPYELLANNLAKILKNPAITEQYNVWLEFQETGVPYAANTQVAGCDGRKDVFAGTLEIISNTNKLESSNDFLLPLNFMKNLNNYKEGASDAMGTTARTITFDLPQPVTSANFHLITSNHGSNDGGEEYNRRYHYIYIDGTQKLYYKPGETSCEPYRQYNTQSNGIYGSTPRSDAQWQSFSNWCPGSKIPTRIIPAGNLSAGTHTFKISVPTAIFKDGQGDIPVSVYLQGESSATLLGIDDFAKSVISYDLSPNPSNDFININTEQEIKQVSVYNMLGQKIWEGKSNKINLIQFESGIYSCIIEFANNRRVSEKIIKN